MIYVTGDLHGDKTRFKSKGMRKLRRGDYLIVCGDFGFLWDDSKKEQKLLKWIGKRRYHVLFVEGTHDNLDLLAQYPESEWNGGKVRVISGKLRYLSRGSIFQLEDSSIFVFGGGASEDSDTRLESGTWWKDELPTLEEVAAARKALAQRGNAVDYIITHQPSRRIGQFLSIEKNEMSILDAFLDEVRENCRFKRWYFGCVHLDKPVPPAEVALFRCVVPLTDGRIRFNF